MTGAKRFLFLSCFIALPALVQAAEKKPVLLGIDALEARQFDALRGKQVGLITNQTGVDSNGRNTADVLARAPQVRLVALFSPEHGIRGTVSHGQGIGDTIDPRTHLPVYSLYGTVQRPTPEMLNAIDVLVFDIQDVGARYYTYLATMGMALEEAARRKIEFMVLDRPNPLGGAIIEGPVADPKVRHITAYYSLPVRHGFTAGELAKWYNETAQLNAKVEVIPMIAWNREALWEDTGLNFIGPSPNIQTPGQALLYAGIGMFEATNLSVGRGTPDAFRIVGAPWIKGKNFARRMKAVSLPGVKFSKTIFIPNSELYQGKRCNGVQIEITDAAVVRPVDVFVHMACVLRELYPNDFQPRWEEIARVTGTFDFEQMYKNKQTPLEILDTFHKNAAPFMTEREKFLLY